MVYEEIYIFLINLFCSYVLYMCIFPDCCFCQRTYAAQGLVNGVHNETWTHSCSQFECFFPFGCGFYIEVILYFSLSVFTLVCFTPLWYLICFCRCVCVCVCTLEWFWASQTVIFLQSRTIHRNIEKSRRNWNQGQDQRNTRHNKNN